MGNNAQLLILSQINRLHGLPVRIGNRESKVELEFRGSQTALKCGVIFVEQIEGDDEKSDGKEEGNCFFAAQELLAVAGVLNNKDDLIHNFENIISQKSK
ncbi:hypothetical protein GOBAR_DD22089 [Gossypium barbadense]|nr:hypothetical protein GOBAR_DD22089 [Gossypium barbadense]